MRHRYPLPTLWLFTDERLGEALWPALRRLPRGAGVIVRHYRLPLTARRLLWRRIRRIARARGLVLLRAGPVPLGAGEAGVHGAAPRRRPGWRTLPVHDAGELARAARRGADAVFVSPVYATASHPGAAATGVRMASRLARGAPMPAMALGGVTARRARQLARRGFLGWGAIDALVGDQKRNDVPR